MNFKRLFFIIIATMMISTTRAQFDFSSLRIDAGLNYTMYKGEFQKNTPGVKVRLSVPDNDRMAIGLGFTYGFPIKTPSEVGTTGGGTVPSEFVYNFKTFSLEYDYYFGGDNEEGFSVYASARMALVLVNFKEKIKGTVPSGEEPTDLFGSANESGFTINGALGAQYASGGRMRFFADAGFALPANQVNNQYVSNPIPFHLMFNAGVRFSLGGGSDY